MMQQKTDLTRSREVAKKKGKSRRFAPNKSGTNIFRANRLTFPFFLLRVFAASRETFLFGHASRAGGLS